MSLIDAAISRSRATLLLLATVLLMGLWAYVQIPKEAEPDVSIPIIYVSMTHEGISPEDAERLLVRPMEKELKTIEGAKEMRSTASQGAATVLLEFEAGFDSDRALDDVRERVDFARRELPADTEEPRVHEVNLSLFPVLVVSLGGHVEERTLLRLARDLRDRIEGISSVLEARIAGDREEQVEIVIDPTLLESYEINARDVIEAVGRSNRLIAAGTMDTSAGRFAIKVPGLFESVWDILDMPLRASGDATVRVGDIGSVRRNFKDRTAYARTDGRPAVSLEVSKRTGENIIETIERVRAVVNAEAAGWPEGVEVVFSQDKSRNIRAMLLDLQNNVTSAILLVLIVVVAVLGVRTGLLVGIAIPGSFLTGILVLALLGFTVNIVVLFALILAVGMLVDGAIVVTEFAERRMREGAPPRQAYAAAAKRMAWPIIASTATTLAAFMPLLFWPGVVGEFMKFLPITLIATLAASLAMALVFVPTLGAHFGRPVKGVAQPEFTASHAIGGFTGAYVRFLRAALHHPGKVVGLAVLALVAAWALYLNYGRGIEFFPDVEPEQAIIQIHARGNLSIDEQDRLVSEVEREVLSMQRERGEFRAINTVAGEQPRRDDQPADIIGTIRLEFAEWDRRRPADRIIGEILARSAGFAGIEVESRKAEAGPPVGKPIQIQVSSRWPDAIPPVVAAIRNHMDGMSGLVDVEDSRPVPGIEWEVSVDRAQAAKFGADVAGVGSVIQLVTKGLKFSEYRPDDTDEEIDIVARFPAEWRTIDQLDRIRIQTDMGLVPIGNFVQRTARQKTGELFRVDGLRTMTVKSEVVPGVLADTKVREIQSWLATRNLDPRVDISFKGEDEEQKSARAFLSTAFLFALAVMAVILVTQFNSFYSTFLILSAVVMSTIGVMLGLLAIGQPFGIVMSGIGVIALAGIVVNNNIVLIDTHDRLRAEIADPMEAILLTGAQRLRPVLLTAATTILGVLPMTLQINIDFIAREVTHGAPSTQWWMQISTAIAFGLGFATLLTLIVTPSALMLRANAAAWLARRRRKVPSS